MKISHAHLDQTLCGRPTRHVQICCDHSIARTQPGYLPMHYSKTNVPRPLRQTIRVSETHDHSTVRIPARCPAAWHHLLPTDSRRSPQPCCCHQMTNWNHPTAQSCFSW